MANRESATNPAMIRNFDQKLNSNIAPGLMIIASIPSAMIETVYIIRFRISVAVATPAGIPSLIIK